ncbi:hypothetical protein IFM89_026041 [Coptis chinensis]|uniref:Uncharacterized protein n=1 Tax=Coptis chinensis TaxID=261450 RepID=A0A835H971_9MAGN|nr:hypothetical protein IFM89_026041 [Coptis chinensis]
MVNYGNSVPTSMVAVDNLLYMFFQLDLFVYDWENPNVGLKRVYGCFPELPKPFPFSYTFPMYPFYVGDGNFCLVWCPSPCITIRSFPTEGMVFCVKFHVNREVDYKGKCYLYATFLGCDIFTPDAGPIFSEYAAVQSVWPGGGAVGGPVVCGLWTGGVQFGLVVVQW